MSRPDARPVLFDVVVDGGLVGDDGHEAELGVLLLDEILADLLRQVAAEKKREIRIRRGARRAASACVSSATASVEHTEGRPEQERLYVGHWQAGDFWRSSSRRAIASTSG